MLSVQCCRRPCCKIERYGCTRLRETVTHVPGRYEEMNDIRKAVFVTISRILVHIPQSKKSNSLRTYRKRSTLKVLSEDT